MEKYRRSGREYRCHRLLTAVLLLTLLPAACFCAVNIRTLKITASQSSCFVGETVEFVLEIPEYQPGRVDVTVQATPDGVALMSSTLDEYTAANGTKGTRILMNFKFTKKGTYKIPSLSAHIDWYWPTYPFPTITVYEDPKNILPETSIKLPKTIYAQEPFTIEIQSKFFQDVEEVYFDPDENAIIMPSAGTVSLPFSQESFSENTYTVASYEITPIEAGTFTVPSFHVLLRTYAGKEVILTPETQKVKVQPARKKSTVVVDETAYSWDEGVQGESMAETSAEEMVSDDVSVMSQTPEEKAARLKDVFKTFKILFWTGIAVLVLAVAGIITGAVLRKKMLVRLSIWCAAAAAFMCVVMVFMLQDRKAVVTANSQVYSIPEKNVSVISTVSQGEIVKVKAIRTGGWYSVSLDNGSEGWILDENCIYCGE